MSGSKNPPSSQSHPSDPHASSQAAPKHDHTQVAGDHPVPGPDKAAEAPKPDPREIDPYVSRFHPKDVPVQLAATPATLFGTEMAALTGNVSGGAPPPQVLIPTLQNGKRRTFVANLALAAQASGSVIGIARLPVPYTMVGIMALASVSLGTATMAIGSPSDSSQAGYWSPAAALTVTTPSWLGVNASLGVPIYVGYDCLTGQAAGYQPGHQGGGQYDDIILTIGAAALPGAGNLRLFFDYLVD